MSAEKDIDIDNPFSGEESEKWSLARTMYEKNPNGLPSKSRFNKRVHKAVVVTEAIEKLGKEEWGIKLNLKRDITDPAKDHYRSIDGKGRDEWVDISKSEDKEKKNILQKLAGL